MELLDLQPPHYGVQITGIYIIDDDGIRIFAGPFESEITALNWLEQRQEALLRGRSAHASSTEQTGISHSSESDTTEMA